MKDQPIEISIIIPIRDEAENIEALAHELSIVLDKCPWVWECIWVDDGSTDQGPILLDRLAESDGRHRSFALEKNAGQSSALWAGFKASKGVILVTLDGDGQNDPADIPRFVEVVHSDKADMVQGYREIRKDNLMRRISSRIANAFRNRVMGESFRDAGCSTRAFKKACVTCILEFSGMHRFLPTLIAMQGFRLTEMPARHRPRLRGQSKYSIQNRIWTGLADIFGVLWLKKRFFQNSIVSKSKPKER